MAGSLLFLFSVLLLISGSACTQVYAPNCSSSTYAWMLNTLDQGPCLVAAYIAAPCSGNEFTVTPVLPQESYLGPNGQDEGGLCMCNTVAYSLISACSFCQGGTWNPYSEWTFNCTANSPPGTISEPIPAGTRIPHWAYLDPTANNTWNPAAAQLAGDSPEVTGSASNIVATSTKSQSTLTPQTSSPSASSSIKGGTNTGAIAGGVVGGILGAALVASIVLWFTIRRRRAALSAAHNGGQSNMGQIVPYPMRFYDPADPSTWPQGSPPLVVSPINLNRGDQFTGSNSTLRPNQPVYTGLPEP